MKQFSYLILFFFILLSCYNEETQGLAPSETWRLELKIYFASGLEDFVLTTQDVDKWVSSYDPTTGQNPEIGKVLFFHDDSRQFDCLVLYEYATQRAVRIDGSFQGHAFGNVLTPISYDGTDAKGTTTCNFCNGPQGVPIEIRVERIQ